MMKELWKTTKEQFIIAGNYLTTEEKRIHDSDEIVQMMAKESKLQVNCADFIKLFITFQQSIDLSFKTMNQIADHYAHMLASSSQKDTAQTIANVTSALSDLGKTMAVSRIQKYCLDPLILYNSQCLKTLQLGNSRHDAYILKIKSDQSLAKLKAKTVNSEKISVKEKKNKVRNETFELADKAFREAYAKDVYDSDILETTWKAFTFYLYQINEELHIKYNEGISNSFPFDKFSPVFEPLSKVP